MAKIPTILEPGRADGKLINTNAIFDENKSMFQSDINDIQDTLTSDNPNKPLSAKQGKILKELLDTKTIEVGSVPIDTEPTEGNITHIVNSDGIHKALEKKVNNVIFEEINKNQDEKLCELSRLVQKEVTNVSTSISTYTTAEIEAGKEYIIRITAIKNISSLWIRLTLLEDNTTSVQEIYRDVASAGETKEFKIIGVGSHYIRIDADGNNSKVKDLIITSVSEAKTDKLESDIQILNSKVDYLDNKTPVIDVTSIYPLEEGNYYTHETAIAAIPVKDRKSGLIIQYAIEYKNYVIEQFIGNNRNDYHWRDTSKWRFLKSSMASSIYYVTFDTDKATTRKSIPISERKYGLLIAYFIESKLILEQYANNKYIDDASWGLDGYWITITNSQILKTFQGNIFSLIGYVSKINGEIVIDNAYAHSPFIKLDKNYDITAQGMDTSSISLVTYYDEKFNFVSAANQGSNWSTSVVTIHKEDIPNNVYYIRVCRRVKDSGYSFVNGEMSIERLYLPYSIYLENSLELVKTDLDSVINNVQELNEKVNVEILQKEIISPTYAYNNVSSLSNGKKYLLKIQVNTSNNVKVTLNKFEDQSSITTIIVSNLYLEANKEYVFEFIYDGSSYLRAASTTNDVTIIDYLQIVEVPTIKAIAKTQNSLLKDIEVLEKESISLTELFYIDEAVDKTGGTVVYHPTATSMCHSTPFIKIDKNKNLEVAGYSMASTTSTKVSVINFYDKDLKYLDWIDNSNGGKSDTTGQKTINLPKELIPQDAVYVRCTYNDYYTYPHYFINGKITLDRIIIPIEHEIKTQSRKITANTEAINELSSEIAKKVDSVSYMADKYDTFVQRREMYLRQKYHYDNIGKWYGVTWDEGYNAHNVTDISSDGDENLCSELPIQKKMKRCIIKNGVFQYYLNANNSNLKEDGTLAILDGTDGNVMVEIPEFFYKFEVSKNETGENVVKLKISEYGIDGFNYSPKHYVSAYHATLNRQTNKLVSVCNTIFNVTEENLSIVAENNYTEGTGFSLGRQTLVTRTGFTENAKLYRGGHQNADALVKDVLSNTNVRSDYWDNENDISSPNFCLNKLGVAIASVQRSECREQANMDIGETMYLYDTQKALWILSTVEFKTRNIQDAINKVSPREGGLGKGATVYPNYTAYERFYNYRGTACIQNGVTNTLGNHSGEVYYRMYQCPLDDDLTIFGNVLIPVMSYRGVENFYGHLYSCADQLSIVCKVASDGNNDVEYFYQRNPFKCNKASSEYEFVGKYTYKSTIRPIKELVFGFDGHILPCFADGGYNNTYCDCVEIGTRDDGAYQAVSYNGRLVSGDLVGRNFIVSFWKDDERANRASESTRICAFIMS